MTEQKTETKGKKTNWLRKSTYEKASKEIANWPQWKKDAFNQFYSMKGASNSPI